MNKNQIRKLYSLYIVSRMIAKMCHCIAGAQTTTCLVLLPRPSPTVIWVDGEGLVKWLTPSCSVIETNEMTVSRVNSTYFFKL